MKNIEPFIIGRVIKSYLIFLFIFSKLNSQEYLSGLIDSGHYNKSIAIRYLDIALKHMDKDQPYYLEEIVKGYTYLGEFDKLNKIFKDWKISEYEDGYHCGVSYYYPSNKLYEFIPSMREYNFGWVIEKFILEGKYQDAYLLICNINTSNTRTRYLKLLTRYCQNPDTLIRYRLLLDDYKLNSINELLSYSTRNKITQLEKLKLLEDICQQSEFDSICLYKIRAYAAIKDYNLDDFFLNAKFFTRDYYFWDIYNYLEWNPRYFNNLKAKELNKLYNYFKENPIISLDSKFSPAYNFIRDLSFYSNSLDWTPDEIIQKINAREDKNSFQANIIKFLSLNFPVNTVITIMKGLTSEYTDVKIELLHFLINSNEKKLFEKYYTNSLSSAERIKNSIDLYNWIYINWGYKSAEKYYRKFDMNLDYCEKEKIILEEYIKNVDLEKMDRTFSSCIQRSKVTSHCIEIARYYSGLPYSRGVLAEYFYNYKIDKY